MSNKEGEVATKDSWESATPLPKLYGILDLNFTLNEKQTKRIKQGFIPSFMDERWFFYFVDDILYQHRSWTGHCIYQIHFVKNGAGLRATHAEVNRDTGQYSGTDDEQDKKIIEEMVMDIADMLPGTRSEDYGSDRFM